MVVHTQKYTAVIYVEQNLVHRDYSKRMHTHTGIRTHEYMHTPVTTDHERELAADQDSAEWKAWHSQQHHQQQQQQQKNRKRKKKEGTKY